MDTDVYILSRKRGISDVTQAYGFIPIRIVEIELGQPLSAISAVDEQTGQCYQRVLGVVRLHTQPLGLVELSLTEPELAAQKYAPCIWDALHSQIIEHLQQDGLPM